MQTVFFVLKDNSIVLAVFSIIVLSSFLVLHFQILYFHPLTFGPAFSVLHFPFFHLFWSSIFWSCIFSRPISANAIFGRIGRTATEEVVLHLLLTKCVPILLYGLRFIRLCRQQILYEIVSY